MHRNNRRNFVVNYKHINIHKYKNCLYGTNINKITNYIRHFCKKHNIIVKSINVTLYTFTYNGDDEIFTPTKVVLDTYNTNKYVNKLKLICEENEVNLVINNI